MTEFSFDPRVPPALVAALAIALIGSAAFALHRARARVALPIRVLLVVLRAIGTLALVVALLGPSATTREEIVMKPPVLLLADASASMALRDAPDRPTRRQQLVDWARANHAAIERLRAKCDVQQFDFARELALVSDWSDQADGRLTAIGDSIAAALKRTRGRAGATLVLFSDGRSTFGSDPLRSAAQARERGARVHAVAIGDPENANLKDRRVHNLLCPSVAQVNASFPINAFISSLGEKGAALKVVLSVDDREVESRDVVSEQDSFSTKLTFLYTPAEAGEKKIRVSVVPGDSEFDTTNNALSSVVRVTQKELRILYVDGKLRWDYTFLRRALAQIPGAHFQTINLFAGARAAGPAPDMIKTFNVVIIGDVKAAALGAEFLAAIEAAVRERELGLLFLAGPSNLASDAGYVGTPMAALLPFELEGAAPPEERPTLVRITSQGLSQFAVTLDRDYGQNVKAWHGMPKLEAVARAGALKPGAIALATAENDDPLLLTQTYGKGRVLCFMAETAWKWALESEETGEKYRRFWHQSVLWLAKKEKSTRRLWLDLPRYLFLAGEPVEATVSVEDPPGSPLPDASVQIIVQGPAGGVPAPPAAFYGGTYHATIVPTEPGEYTITAAAKHHEEDIGRTSARFLVTAPNSEFDQPGAAPEALVGIATAGDGAFCPLPSATELIDQIARDAAPLRVERVHRRTLWDRAWLILLFVAALSVEWGVRKGNRLL